VPSRDHLVALGWLRERIRGQTAVDPGQGVWARRALLSLEHPVFGKDRAQAREKEPHPNSIGMEQALDGRPGMDIWAALDMLNVFERAIVENHDRHSVEARRLKCLEALDRVLYRLQSRNSGGI